MPYELRLQNPINVVTQPEITKQINKITIELMVDNPSEKVVKVYCPDLSHGPIVLWSGDAYDAIGQWTDQDVRQALTEKYNFIIDETPIPIVPDAVTPPPVEIPVEDATQEVDEEVIVDETEQTNTDAP